MGLLNPTNASEKESTPPATVNSKIQKKLVVTAEIQSVIQSATAIIMTITHTFV